MKQHHLYNTQRYENNNDDSNNNEDSDIRSVIFPPISSGVSTHKMDDGNGELIEKFILANYENFGGEDNTSYDDSNKNKKNTKQGSGIFLDMQAVAENMIGSRGAWRSLVLVPHGNLYRVYKQPKQSKLNTTPERPLGLELSEEWIRNSSNSLDVMKSVWTSSPSSSLSLSSSYLTHNKNIDDDNNDDDKSHISRVPPAIDRFISGSWEFAALSVFYDAHYQLSLYYLTYCLDLADGISISELSQFTYYLYKSTDLLNYVIINALGIDNDNDINIDIGAIDIEKEEERKKSNNNMLNNLYPHTLSSSKKDVLKNNALANVRYQSAISIFNQNPDLLSMFKEDIENDLKLLNIIKNELIQYNVTRNAMKACELFIYYYPKDKDVLVFKDAINKYKDILASSVGKVNNEQGKNHGIGEGEVKT